MGKDRVLGQALFLNMLGRILLGSLHPYVMSFHLPGLVFALVLNRSLEHHECAALLGRALNHNVLSKISGTHMQQTPSTNACRHC